MKKADKIEQLLDRGLLRVPGVEQDEWEEILYKLYKHPDKKPKGVSEEVWAKVYSGFCGDYSSLWKSKASKNSTLTKPFTGSCSNLTDNEWNFYLEELYDQGENKGKPESWPQNLYNDVVVYQRWGDPHSVWVKPLKDSEVLDVSEFSYVKCPEGVSSDQWNKWLTAMRKHPGVRPTGMMLSMWNDIKNGKYGDYSKINKVNQEAKDEHDRIIHHEAYVLEDMLPYLEKGEKPPNLSNTDWSLIKSELSSKQGAEKIGTGLVRPNNVSESVWNKYLKQMFNNPYVRPEGMPTDLWTNIQNGKYGDYKSLWSDYKPLDVSAEDWDKWLNQIKANPDRIPNGMPTSMWHAIKCGEILDYSRWEDKKPKDPKNPKKPDKDPKKPSKKPKKPSKKPKKPSKKPGNTYNSVSSNSKAFEDTGKDSYSEKVAREAVQSWVGHKPSQYITCYIYDMLDDKKIEFFTIPEGVNESYSADWNQQEIPGRSAPYISFTGNPARTVDYSIKLDRNLLGVKYKDVINDIKALVYPHYVGGGVVAPPYVYVKFGGMVNMFAVVDSVSTSWEGPILGTTNMKAYEMGASPSAVGSSSSAMFEDPTSVINNVYSQCEISISFIELRTRKQNIPSHSTSTLNTFWNGAGSDYGFNW